jgi:transposase-like protein
MSAHSKETVEVVRAAMALAERDVSLGLANVDDIRSIPRTRFAPVERDRLIALRKAEGKSNREIAEEAGVSQKTVERTNVRKRGGQVSAKSAEKSASPKPKRTAPVDDDDDNIEAGIDKEHLKTGFIIRADQAARFAIYSGPVDDEVRRVAWRAAKAWQELVQKLDGGNSGGRGLGLEDDAFEEAKVDDTDTDDGDSDEVCWRRGLMYRATNAAGEALFEDWSQFPIDPEIVDTIERAAAAWAKLDAYIKQLRCHQQGDGIPDILRR